jgi:N utilization substance protein A
MHLFEIEVPEISEGIVQIVGVARDPGIRAKIGVRSLDKNVDPVGACVGMRGSRIQSIVRELRGEKIDIIEWSDDPAILISRAITPAKVQTSLVNEAERIVDIIVADDQLALAIGKRGQNAKLAVKLTTWKINITSESERKSAVQESFEKAFAQAGFEETELEEENQQPPSFVSKKDDSHYNELLTLKGIGEKTGEYLMEAGFSCIEDIASSTVDVLSSVPGIGKKTAKNLLEMSQTIIENREDGVKKSMTPNPNPQISEVVKDDD